MITKIIVVLSVLLLICILKKKSKSEPHTVYGSTSCGWTTKQLQFFERTHQDYEFVDCHKDKCPAFVKGFPTTIPAGKSKEEDNAKVGYNDKIQSGEGVIANLW